MLLIIVATFTYFQLNFENNQNSTEGQGSGLKSLFGDKLPTFFSILSPKEKQALYYLKDGDIWTVKTSNAENEPILFLNTQDNILDFSISNDKNMVAYSVERNGLEEDPFGGSGDTIIIRNLLDETEFELYSYKVAQPLKQILSILFSPDDSKVFFSSESLRVADLDTNTIKKYAEKPHRNICGFYVFEEITPDGKYALVTDGCHEGSSQIIVNTETGKTETVFENGIIGGITMLGFLNDSLLLGFDNKPTPEEEGTIAKIGLYNLYGELVKELPNTETPYFFYADNNSLPQSADFDFPFPETDLPTKQTAYQINTQDLTTKETSEERTLFIYFYSPGSGIVLFKTDNFFKEFVRIDTNIGEQFQLK